MHIAQYSTFFTALYKIDSELIIICCECQSEIVNNTIHSQKLQKYTTLIPRI